MKFADIVYWYLPKPYYRVSHEDGWNFITTRREALAFYFNSLDTDDQHKLSLSSVWMSEYQFDNLEEFAGP